MQHGVEHPVHPLNFVPGAPLDLLNQGVTVAFTLGEQGEDQRFGRSGHQFFCEHNAFFLPIHGRAMYVKREKWA